MASPVKKPRAVETEFQEIYKSYPESVASALEEVFRYPVYIGACVNFQNYRKMSGTKKAKPAKDLYLTRDRLKENFVSYRPFFSV